MNVNEELKNAVEAMYLLALAACRNRDDCMRVSTDVRSMINRLDRVAEEDCYDRAMELEKATA